MTNYTSDNGGIAFGDPFDLIKKKEAKARKAMHTKFG